MIDLLIMSYVLLLGLLIFQAEKLQQNALKVILIGIFLTPIVGFMYLNYYRLQTK